MKSIFYLFFVNPKVFHNELRNIDKAEFNNGFDNRIIEMNNTDSIYRINEIHYKKNLLDKLTSNLISIQDKIDIIDKHDIMEKNI
jgi:hypothetical protein